MNKYIVQYKSTITESWTTYGVNRSETLARKIVVARERIFPNYKYRIVKEIPGIKAEVIYESSN